MANAYIEKISAATRRHGVLPPLLFVSGDTFLQDDAVLFALQPLGYGPSDILDLDLSEPDGDFPDQIRRHEGPLFLRNLDVADPKLAAACLAPEALGPMCRPVFATLRTTEIPDHLKRMLQMVVIESD